MNLNELLTELSQQNMELRAEGDQVRVRAAKGTLTPEIRDSIAEHKTQLLDLLQKSNMRADNTSLPSVVPAPDKRYDPFPLTDIQYAYWIGRNEIYELGNVVTHAYLELDCQDLNLERLNLAWQKVIERHEMLRAVVLPDGQQQILEQVPPYQISVLDLCGQSAESIDFTFETLRQRMSHQVRLADQWPLFEIQAVHLDNQHFQLHLSFDVLMIDMGSLLCLFREWSQLYQNPKLELPLLELSFRDYVLAEKRLVETQLYQRSQDYWFNRLDTLPPAPELPLLKSPSSCHQPRFHRRTFRLDPELWQQLKKRAISTNLTSSGVLLAAFAEVLTAWSKYPQFTINITLFNRLPLHPQVNQIAGDFTSLTLLQVDNSTVNESFASRAVRLQKQLWQDLDYHHVSGVHILRELARRQGNSRRSIMPIVFTSALAVDSLDRNNSGLSQFGEMVYGVSQTPQVLLDHQVIEQDQGLIFNWDAVENLFPPGMLEDMFNTYCHFLARLATDESVWYSTTRQLIPPEQLSQRDTINATEAPLSNEMLHTLFISQVERCSDHCAVISPQRTLTYLELSKLARQVGYKLRQLGASPNNLVAVVMEKGWEQVVGVLGILMSGAAYLPIDPELPTERQKYLLDQGEVKIALTQSHLNEKLEWSAGIYRLNVDNQKLTDENLPIFESVQSPEDLAYVVYTSGSTGVPKGVMIDHQGAVNTILDINQRFQVGEQDRVLALSALNFDLSVYDIFGILAAGGTIVIPEAAATKDPSHWMELIARHQVTLWNSVPALMQMFVEYVRLHPNKVSQSLRLALLSGDWLPLNLPTQIKSLWPNALVVSLGGATEASIWSIFYPIEKVSSEWKSIPYGRPMTNQYFYVLNEALEPCPVWVTGQLYIGGTGLAKGYWKDDLKTHSSFIIHPRTRKRLYKTGDLGRYLPDGNIEFLGRKDFQVKINGYRIELGEIETILEQHPLVNHAVVTAAGETRENKQLVAYIVSNSFSSSQEQLAASNQIAEAYRPSQSNKVLTDPVKRLEFKLKQPGLRLLETNRFSVELIKPQFDEVLIQTYVKRQSYRHFLDTPIPFAQFSELLSCLLQIKLNNAPLPKYRYASAGNLYPVQTYLYVKPGRVEGLEAGTYYYHPADHRLVLLSPEAVIERHIHSEINQPIFDESAFSLFLIGQLSAITPMYGELARDFCLLEAGYISQLLMSVAPASQIGLCPVGAQDFAAIQNVFEIDSNHILLHSFFGGRIELEKTQQALQPKATPSVATIADELRSFLQGKVPDYMVPAIYVLLDTLPLTVNGKVDRRALPTPALVQSKLNVVDAPPQTEVERTLANIVQAVLQVETVGIHSNFFELGANSVHMIQIYNKLKEALGIDVAIVEMFKHPTINFLAKYLSQEIDESSSLEQIHDRVFKQKEAIKQQKRLMEKRKNG
nr:TPA_exp: ArzO - NRPS (Cy, A, Ox, PCP) [Fischerella sp. PCC 9339]